MYVEGNPKSKKELKALVSEGRAYIFSPGPFPAKQNGREFVEGPHYPQPHRWYAQVEVEGGKIVKVVS